MQLLSRAVFVCIAALMVVSLAHDADGAQKKKKKKGGLAGIVINIDRGSKGDFVTIQTLADKKAGAGVQRKFEITKDTKFEKTVGKKQDKKTVEGTIADLLQGEMISVDLRSGSNDVAEKITLGKAKKKKAT